jgi:hypothetical protein
VQLAGEPAGRVGSGVSGPEDDDAVLHGCAPVRFRCVFAT